MSIVSFGLETDYKVPSMEEQTAVERLVELQSRHCKKEVS